LRNPRPTGAISGRDLPAAYRWDFSTVVSQVDPVRIDGWWASHGSVAWNSSSQTLNFVNNESVATPWLIRGYNGTTIAPSPLSIDASVYKYAVSVFKVNRFPDTTKSIYDTFRGNLYFSDDTTTIGIVNVISMSVDRLGNATFTLQTADTGPVAGSRVQLNRITGSYPKYGGGVYDLTGTVSTGGINSYPPVGDDNVRDKWMVTAADSTTFTLAGLEVSGEIIDGDSSSLAISGTVGPTYPWTAADRQQREQKGSTPYFPNYQASNGFLTAYRDMAGWYKVVWDMTDHPNWTGTITGLRFDYFFGGASVSSPPDGDAGDIDIDYIEVVAFHNIDL